MNLCDDGAVTLANEIIIRAADDYRDTLAYFDKYEEEKNKFLENDDKVGLENWLNGKTGKKSKLTRKEVHQKMTDLQIEVKNFFHSNWYKTLTNVEGEWLLAKIEEQYEIDKQKRLEDEENAQMETEGLPVVDA